VGAVRSAEPMGECIRGRPCQKENQKGLSDPLGAGQENAGLAKDQKKLRALRRGISIGGNVPAKTNFKRTKDIRGRERTESVPGEDWGLRTVAEKTRVR